MAALDTQLFLALNCKQKRIFGHRRRRCFKK